MAKFMKTVDGNTAAAHVAYAFTEVAAIYPITPSSTMAELVDEWSSQGRKNVFGQRVNVVEMQSEAGAAGAFHGSLQAGALTSTFTASQGLLLMIPNMYKVAGELLPGVFHVTARAIASQALSIFGDHQDVMACRQTGACLLCSGSVQEVADIAPVAHMSAIEGSLPFLHFFDGFRTSHEIQKVELMDNEEYSQLIDMDAVQAFRDKALSPNHPVTRGTAQNPDIYFQTREVSNKYYDNIIDIVEKNMAKVSELTGRKHSLFDYYGAEDAKHVVVAMGSVTEALEETIDYLNAKGEKLGVVKVHLYRPFSKKHFLAAMPKTVERIAVLDRTKEPGSLGEPLFLDICNIYKDVENAPLIVGGRYGLGSKDTTPTDLNAVFENLNAEKPASGFTIGIVDDVTNTSLPAAEPIKISSKGTVRCKFWGLGSDGTVGANKQAIKIIGDHTDKYAQAYFDYDSKKSGGITMSHLRFGDTPIRATYLLDEADYIACHNQSYVYKYDLLKGLRKGGTFVLNTIWDAEGLEEHLPAEMKQYIAKNDIQFYTINAVKIGQEIGLGNRINMICQAAFFKLADIIPVEDAVKYLKESIVKAYGKKGEAIVNMNYKAVDAGIDSLVKVDVPASWADAVDAPKPEVEEPAFIKDILRPMVAQKGNDLPVSTFLGYEDGTFPCGTAAYEKRGIAVNVPEWKPENCIQCNRCSFVCPHACIRPVLVTEEELAAAPESFVAVDAKGKELKGLKYRMQVGTMDCTGCGNCADVCPAKQKALVMEPLETQEKEVENWAYAVDTKKVAPKADLMNVNTVKGSQFRQPLIEFSGACAGCGETPYIKVVTQLFGDRMMIANATGCSSIWGGSAPSTPYTCNHEGKGPSWANSLFEDNAEYGLGMRLAVKQMRNKLEDDMKALIEACGCEDCAKVLNAWIDAKEDSAASVEASKAVLELLETANPESDEAKALVESIKSRKDYLVKRSQWILGGDGWAYDIGYGGVDHVLASGENVNVLVFDTEVYSNTGGQSSKATPLAAMAKFAAAGKRSRKKDLGMMAMSYGNVYVAQVAIGADYNQFVKAIVEAEAYDGPSLIICYAPCINHGLKCGMGKTIQNESDAVKCGYWHLYRHNPELKAEGKNPFTLDSKEPTESFRDFIMGQVRYASIAKQFPEQAEELFTMAEQSSKDRLESYKRLANQ
ncbi:pyruvate:ferredoxin (flavodoxin) oxidoreductase [Intestinibacter bartlettii]|uniref:Pyruvate:ferredoxin oxidoreductase n=2 Tax=Intestinibacter bartlettii TaxID=261299 RepID=A0ABS6DYX4_9FIRM|nr:pyruvate:ferredoxin (flavodoxin) oxidoreductase [Intestinibacter bartlettii]MBU5337042.1 pyruvate:ferredoxin (flavodoxin) oxidoreductase [Intestinibacter bartlettii]